MQEKPKKAKFPFQDSDTVTWTKDTQGFIQAHAIGVEGGGGSGGCCHYLTNGEDNYIWAGGYPIRLTEPE